MPPLKQLFLTYEVLMETVFNTIPILVADLVTGEILFANAPLERLFGYYMLGELRGKQVEVLLPHAFRERHVNHRGEYAQNPRSRSMASHGSFVYALKRDGMEFPVHIGLSAAVIDGQPCAIAIVADLSEQPLRSRIGT